MDTFETAFRLTIRGFGRELGGHEELMGRSDLDVWKSADKFISSRSYNIRNEQVLLNIDWRAAIQHVDFWYDVGTSPEKIIDFFNDKIAIPEEIDPVKIDAIIIMPAILKDDKHKDIRYEYLIHFIHDIYLVMNLASPGCCNLGYSTISTIDESWSKTINLSGFIFEKSWHDSLENKWPKVTSFLFDIVFEWFDAFNIGTRSLAESPIHKALFALLHVAHGMGEPASLIWLAHALESLYDTPPNLAYSFLKHFCPARPELRLTA